MQVFDLSHPLFPGMPVYPGTEPPNFSTPCTIEKDGFLEKKLTMYSHTGTHIDAPAHIIPGARTLDQLPIESFCGLAVVLDLSEAGDLITLGDLERFEGMIKAGGFVLLHTGWSRLWGQDAYFEGFPVLTPEAALWLSRFNLKGVGVDAISVDAVGSTEFPVHKVFLQRETLIVENLTNLAGLTEKACRFSCFPLRIVAADGSPVRAVAALEG